VPISSITIDGLPRQRYRNPRRYAKGRLVKWHTRCIVALGLSCSGSAMIRRTLSAARQTATYTLTQHGLSASDVPHALLKMFYKIIVFTMAC
jgi:hypothetical protein